MFVAEVRDSLWPKEVHLYRSVEWGIEGHRGRRVDDDISAKPKFEIFAAQPESVRSDIARNRLYAPRSHLVEDVFAEVLAQSVERIILQYVACDSGLRAPPTGSDQQDELTVWYRANEAFDQSRSEETGGTGNRDSFSRKVVGNHNPLSNSYATISTNW